MPKPKTAIYAYNTGSASAKALKEALGVALLKREGPERRVNQLINWGCSEINRPLFGVNKMFNVSVAVAVASNKLSTFEVWGKEGVETVPWTTDKAVAQKWVDEDDTVVVRHSLTGHSGKGIELVSEGKVPDAKLYTKYVGKKEEYRFHFFRGKLIHVQRKARKKDVPDDKVNWKVRNLDGGFIFALQEIDAFPAEVVEKLASAVDYLGLDFGAVDVIYNARLNKYFPLEVNTAPGLEGTTLERYTAAFKQELGL